MTENMQSDEQKEVEWLEMEQEMMKDPLYYLFNVRDNLEIANELLWNQGNNKTREFVQNAIYNIKIAMKILEDKNDT